MMYAAMALGYVGATFVAYVAFRRFPDQSPPALIQMALFYLVTVIYPIGWSVQHGRLLKRLGLHQRLELRRQAWAPVIVGGTALLIGVSLLLRLPR
jgi:hypothetical protein